MRTRSSSVSQRTKIRTVVACSTLVAALPAVGACSALAATQRPADRPAIARISASTPPAPAGWKPGWLVKPSAYIGRYRLVASTSRSPKPNAHLSGQLTLFMQHAYASKPPTPSGILALHARTYDVVFYLTDLDHDGTTLESLVHGGAFVAPATGRFRLSKLADGRIVGTLEQKGFTMQTLTFKRFSTNPQP